MALIKPVVQILLILSLIYEAPCKDDLVEENLAAIQKHEEILQQTVKEDLKTIGQKFDEFVDNLNTEMEAVSRLWTPSLGGGCSY